MKHDEEMVIGLSARGRFIVGQALELFIKKSSKFAADAFREDNAEEHAQMNALVSDAQDLLKALPSMTFEGSIGPEPSKH